MCLIDHWIWTIEKKKKVYVLVPRHETRTKQHETKQFERFLTYVSMQEEKGERTRILLLLSYVHEMNFILYVRGLRK